MYKFYFIFLLHIAFVFSMFPYTHAYSNWLTAAFSLVTSLLNSVKRPLMATNTNFNKFRVAKSENYPFFKIYFLKALRLGRHWDENIYVHFSFFWDSKKT